MSAIRSQPRQSAHFDAAQSTIPLMYDMLFILSSRPRTEEGQMGQERPILSKPCPLSVSFHKRQIAALRVELRRARLESPELGFAGKGGRQAMSRRRLSTSAESCGTSR